MSKYKLIRLKLLSCKMHTNCTVILNISYICTIYLIGWVEFFYVGSEPISLILGNYQKDY